MRRPRVEEAEEAEVESAPKAAPPVARKPPVGGVALITPDMMRQRAATTTAASPETQRAAKLAKAGLASQGRSYEGHSLAYMMNQEAMTTLQALKPTGSLIPASGKPNLVSSANQLTNSKKK